jgi:hypothetical protein
MKKYGILPTPYFIEEKNIIRIFFGTSAEDNVCKITYLDVNADNPSEVIYLHKEPILTEGEAGLFDDSGVNPSSIISIKKNLFLYYVGYQRTVMNPYMLFPGLALSEKNSFDFRKLKKVPLIDRSDKFPFSLAAPFVMFDGKFKMWLWLAKRWVTINSKKYLEANIGYAESSNGIDWNIIYDKCIETNNEVFSVGRPWVLLDNNLYKMFYSVRYVDKLYRIGYAESKDGIHWERKDNEAGIDVSENGWDSEMMCYPAVIKVKGKTFLFYNGNNNGATGFGYAELDYV